MEEGVKDGNSSLSGFSSRSRFITVLLCRADLFSLFDHPFLAVPSTRQREFASVFAFTMDLHSAMYPTCLLLMFSSCKLFFGVAGFVVNFVSTLRVPDTSIRRVSSQQRCFVRARPRPRTNEQRVEQRRAVKLNVVKLNKVVSSRRLFIFLNVIDA